MAQSYQVDIVTKVVGASKIAQLEKSLKKLDHNSAKVSRAAGQMSGSLKRASGQLASTGGSARRASAGVKAFGAATVGATGTLKAFGAALASYLGPIAAVAAAVGGLAKSFQIAGEREADARALANGLQKIGAEKGAIDSLQVSADKLGKTTLFNQEDFTKGYKLLTSFRNIGLESYEEVSMAAADMATVIGGDVNSSLLQLAKALENPAVGLTYLSRSGTTFTDSQKAMIKSLQESGDLLGAQAEIMKVVQQQYAGAALAAGKSGLAGAFDSMMETLRDAGEVIGKALEPLAVGAMNAITVAVQKMGDVWNVLKAEVFPGLASALQPIYENFKAIVEQINWKGLVDLVGVGLVGAFKALEFALKPILWLINNMLKGLKALMDSPVGKLLGSAFNNVAAAIDKANEKAGGLKDKTEATVKPVSELRQNLELTQQPLGDAADKAGLLKTALDGTPPPAADLAEKAGFISEALSGASANGLNLADQLKKMRTEAAGVKKEATDVKEKVQETVAPTKELVQQNELIKERLRLQITEQALIDAKADSITQKTQQIAQNEGQAAQNAQQLAQNQAGANAQINEGAGAAGRLAGQMERAAAAAARLGGGRANIGSGDATKQWTNAYRQINKSKLDAEGNIVQKTDKEIQREKNQHIVNGWKGGFVETKTGGADEFAAAAFDASWFAAGLTAGDARDQAHSLNMYGGMVGPRGSIVDREYNNAFGHRTHFAAGGYVTGPQQAIVGEGGEPEYIIPASKLDGAMQRYSAGMRGESMIPQSANVNVNYNGSTVDMGGTSYINKGDVNGIVSQAVNQTLTTLQRSSKARLTAGLR